MLKSKHFKTERELIEWFNSSDIELLLDCKPCIIKDVTNGDWIIFYIEYEKQRL